MERRSPWLEQVVVEPGLEARFPGLPGQCSYIVIIIIITFILSHSLRLTCNALLNPQLMFLLRR